MRTLALVATVAFLAPSVLAASPFSSTSLGIDGTTTIAGPGAALFLVTDIAGTTWGATASSVTVQRTWEGYAAASDKFGFYDPSPTTETQTYGASTLTSEGSHGGAGLLARAASTDFAVRSA